MIKFININKSFSDQLLFEDLNLSINTSERVGLVGRNGHGKSTLFQIILGNTDIDSGQLSIPKNYKIGHLEQHLKFSQPTALEEASLGLSPEDIYDTWKVEMILSGLGFSEQDMSKDPNQFSGGYQIRLNLAKLLVSNPDMLLLDEPNNYLDIVAIRWLEDFLKSWQGEIILITHDRSFMDSVVTHTVAIHRRKAIKIAGDTDKLYDFINKEEEIYEKTRLNEAKKRRQEEIFIARFKARASFASRAQSRVKMLDKQGEMKKLERIEDMELFFNSAEFTANKMMSVENISFSYGEGLPLIINDFTLYVGKRDRICIIGKNGKGKSTLIKIMAGLLKPVQGTVYKNPSLKEGYFGQTNKLDLDDQKTVLEEIISADKSCTDIKARTIAGGLMFSGDNALKKTKVLSGGEKSRVLLGKILVTPNNLLFLDEPTNHLDMQSCDSLMEAITEFEGAVVMVTHNEMHIRNIATKLVVFDKDKILTYDGTYDEFLSSVGWADEEY